MGSEIWQSGDFCFAGGMGRPDYCGVSLANRAQQCCAPTDDPTLLKHAAELEVEFAVAGVAIAAADDEWTEGGFGEDADVDVVGKSARLRETVHFGEFVGADRVDFFAEERRQREEVVQVA